MIPQFPEFKNIELSDKAEIESFTKRFPPYSDFNFASMWSWDIKSEIRISILNDNLVVRFCDYLTGEPFLSFMGTNEPTETAIKLLEFSRERGLPVKLKLVPEEAVREIITTKLIVEEDRDSFDYIYESQSLMDFEGTEHFNSRKKIKAFLKNENISFRELDSNSKEERNEILKLNAKWKQNKGLDFDSKNEDIALARLLDSDESIRQLNVGVFLGTNLVAYTINDIDGGCCGAHFSKADPQYRGAYLYCMKITAEKVLVAGCKMINCQQDLGLPGLRDSKLSLRPSSLLKKYIISQK